MLPHGSIPAWLYTIPASQHYQNPGISSEIGQINTSGDSYVLSAISVRLLSLLVELGSFHPTK